MIFKKYVFRMLFLFAAVLSAQTVQISEVVSSNSIDTDEDGDTPDWFELYNTSSQSISLKDWTISDDPDNLSMFVFPDISIPSEGYMRVWASDKDRSEITSVRTFVDRGALFNYLIPTSEPPSNWTDPDFQDSSWAQGTSGFGYDDGDDATEVPTGTRSVYTRISFQVTDLEALTQLVLDMDYDDGFVAYINGNEVARANITGVPPAFDSGTFTDHEAKIYRGDVPERFSIANPQTVLQEGYNTLAIQVHNVSEWSSDMTLIPFLSAIFTRPNSSGTIPPNLLNFSNGSLHTNFKISSKSDQLLLSNPEGELVDDLLVEGLKQNVSMGISPQSGNLVYFLETTPGAPNSSEEYIGVFKDPVVFSVPGGRLIAPVNLELSGAGEGQKIHYTTDASLPTENSPIYTAPIRIANNQVVRAGFFAAGYLPAEIDSKTYLFNTNHEIDFVTLVTDPDNFFDADTGIYVTGPDGTYDTNVPYFGSNFWEDWERPIHFSFYEKETGDLGVAFNTGVKIYGAWSRGQNAQRSLAVFARGEYGTSEFDYPFFEKRTYDKFQALVLRNSGQAWLKSTIRDITLTSLMEGSGLDLQAYTPVATYLNGDYWGLYNLREKNNEHMLASKHEIDAEEIDLLTANAEVVEGTNQEYTALMDYISNTNLSVDANFDYVRERIDIPNYTMYQVAQIYINNQDWPGNNIKFWKHPEGKWRWILYDTDFGFSPWFRPSNDYLANTLEFALEPYGPGWPNPSWSTLLFRKLVENIGFRNGFINRYADELNTRFLEENVKTHIESVLAKVAPELQAHYARWNGNFNDVGYYVNLMKVFAQERPQYARSHLRSRFNLTAEHRLTINNTQQEMGYVEVNDNLKIDQASWFGTYFENVPVRLHAIPLPGFVFSHWSGSDDTIEASIDVNLQSAFQIRPNFVSAETPLKLVINEINYKSSDEKDAGDWVELYNPNETALDLSNWVLKDKQDTNEFVLPIATTIPSMGFLVLVKNGSDFSEAFPTVDNPIGDFDFGFGSDDAVRLFDEKGFLIDEVYYTSQAPWSECADGLGPTMLLESDDLDNALAESWFCGDGYGTPGLDNATALFTKDTLEAINLYPNLISDYLYFVGPALEMNMRIYDLMGKLVFVQKTTAQMDVSFLKKGIYFVQLSDSSQSKTFRIVKR
jgi:hypothetical protein